MNEICTLGNILKCNLDTVVGTAMELAFVLFVASLMGLLVYGFWAMRPWKE